MDPARDITALILAGGAGKRLGGRDKGWMELHGTPLISLLLQRLQPQCARILISANRHLEDYAGLGVPVLRDDEFSGAGPLAGMYAGLKHCTTPALLTIAVDTPFIPVDYAERFAQCGQHAALCIAHDGQREHPTCALIAVSLLDSLHQFLSSGQRRVRDWQRSHQPRYVDFSDRPDTCFNINTPEDLATAEQQRRTSP